MDKLIITVNPAGKGNFPGAPDMDDAEAQAEEAIRACSAGASVAHIHGAMTAGAGSRQPNLEHWARMTDLIRSKTDMIVQFGRAVMKPPVRRELLTLKPDMSSFLLGHHDIITARGPLHALGPLEDLQESARYHLEAGVIAEMEVWHSGNLWNMRQLIDAKLVEPPFYVTLFFGAPGGHWSPDSSQELLSRTAMLPPRTIWGVSAHGPRQSALHALAISEGGHVRTGWEDNPDLHPGRPARSNAELVERIVRLARDLGREVATPAEARQILGLPRKPTVELDKASTRGEA
jgi:3-keto-5-aminohexanoate cleavage enzyme